ncbi:hypothetical protein [Tenacibaculum sp. M341]|uniref:hypothetical protein n=1 Tax=Tenacibaculum sp. M341 TaxID=2530339 RepID=UPI00104AABD7|nr:hypothetical protein [Tenacibaculum sp. M341]TCI90007.1 hypothetical protein EYW44_15180 [Tenacibaculum sp. M341]
MNLILTILAAVVVAVLLAIVIVKFVPLKLRGLISILLLLVSFYLGYLIYNGVMEPIKFNKEKKVRYAKVIKNLKLIRDAQIKYKEAKGVYTKKQDKLINFIENDSLVLTETVNYTEKVDKGGGIQVDVSKKRIDTIGKEPVLKYFKNKDYTNMFKVPGTDKEFELGIGEIEKITGLFVPVFEAKIDKKSILKDLPIHLVKQELEAVETDQIKGPNVSVGSLQEVSTGGNWPPFYDKGDAKADAE